MMYKISDCIFLNSRNLQQWRKAVPPVRNRNSDPKRKQNRVIGILMPVMVGFCLLMGSTVLAATLNVGAAKGDITPKRPVPLWGQFELRISTEIKNPLFANVTAVEAKSEDGSCDSAIFISADLLYAPDKFRSIVCKKITDREPEICPDKVVFNATHTHTAPTLNRGPKLPENVDVENYEQTIEYMTDRIAEIAVDAWHNRRPAEMAWGIEPVVVGESRRMTYSDGHADMYGDPTTDDFLGFENMTDRDMGIIVFREIDGKIISIILNIACPAQVDESLSVIESDYWGQVRKELAQSCGEDVVVLGWCSAAGDIVPRAMYRKDAMERMRYLRSVDEKEEIARRVSRATLDALDVIQKDYVRDIPFVHHVETMELPKRLITEAEYNNARGEVEMIRREMEANPDRSDAEMAFMGLGWHSGVVRQYEEQQKGNIENFPAVVHVIRIGDIAVATNPFELFTDYGIRIKTRSPSMATFLIQLVGSGGYLPTKQAIAGGGYSAIIQSARVGSEGGQKLVDETVRMIREIWNTAE